MQPTASPRREVILGVNCDANWGQPLMMGLGALVEALRDVTPAPFDLAVASALIARLKGTALFGHSVAHRPVADTEAFAAVRGGSSR